MHRRDASGGWRGWLALPLLALLAQGEERPNIVLIMADDAGRECFGAYGGEDYQTPRLDALAREGALFANCHSTPICTPSRVKLMTGQYGFRNYTHFGYLSPKERTLGHMLQEAGYRTAIAGKWQLNGIYNQLAGWQDGARPLQAGFHRSLLWQVTRDRAGGGERYWSPMIERDGEIVSAEENLGKYGPELFTDFLCAFMERHRDRPFFLYYPMVLVHDPFVPTPRTVGGGPRDPRGNKAPRDPGERKANFAAMVRCMDRLVGRLADKVEELGLSERTLILFTADNGTHPSIRTRWRGRMVQGGKGSMKDTGTHVPLIARWKGRTPPGTVVADPVDFTDFYPTLAQAAGARTGWRDPVDGTSFLPRLLGEESAGREWILCHYQPYWGKQPGQFAISEGLKLFRSGEFYRVSGGIEEPADPGDPALAAIHARLAALLERCPPAPTGKGGRDTAFRPVWPAWPSLTPGDRAP